MNKVGVRLSGTNLERAADHNQRITLVAIRAHRAITRVRLAEITGLTPATVANITKRLLDDGLIVETGRLRNGRGQPGKVLEINPRACFAFGVNIDRDHVQIVLVDFCGTVIADRVMEAPFALPAQVQAFWQDHVHAMLAQGEVDAGELTGVGVAMPDELGAIAVAGAPDDYAQWQNVDLQALFGGPFAVPVFVENDAAAAVIGEQQFGRGRNFPSIFYILLSSCMGGGLMIDGAQIRGSAGRSAEIGMMPLGDGTARTLQDCVSLVSLAAMLAQGGLALGDLATMREGDEADRIFSAWLDQAARHMAGPLAAIQCLINPAAILIGSRLPVACIDRFCAALDAQMGALPVRLPARSEILRAQLSQSAPAIGATILPFAHFHHMQGDELWKRQG